MTIRRNTQDIDLGLGRYTIDDEQPKPKVQLLIPKQALPEERIHYCSKCNNKIQWLTQSRRWICYSCGVTYSELYDTPLANIDQQIKPLQGDHTEKPALISFKPNEKLQGRGKNPHFQVTGSIRKARITTDNLAMATEDNIRRELEGDEAYEY